MPAVNHLILDVSVIIDLWLGVGSAAATETLMEPSGSLIWPRSRL